MKSMYAGVCAHCGSNACNQKNGFYHKVYAEGATVHFQASNASVIVFVRSGKLSVSGEQVKRYVCQANQVMHLLNHYHYEFTALEMTEVVYMKYITNLQMCDQVHLNRYQQEGYAVSYQFQSLEMREPLQMFVKSIVYYLDGNLNCKYMHRAKELELFGIFRHYYSTQEIRHLFQPSLRKGMEFHSVVTSNHAKAKNVKDLAERCGYSLPNFKKVFAKHFPLSPYQWMQQQTSNRLKSLLLDETIPIKAIVDDLNFTDQSHLNTYCKQHFGVTAAQFRKALMTK